MRKRMVILSAVITLLVGCTWLRSNLFLEKAPPPSPPAINEAYAPGVVQPGDVWRIYLRAIDPDGDMKTIITTMKQGKTLAAPPGVVPIEPANGKALNGYIYLNTSRELQNGTNFTVSVKIEDNRGLFSNEVLFPLTFYSPYTLPSPQLTFFNENNLGEIPVSPHNVAPKKPGVWDRFVAWLKKVF